MEQFYDAERIKAELEELGFAEVTQEASNVYLSPHIYVYAWLLGHEEYILVSSARELEDRDAYWVGTGNIANGNPDGNPFEAATLEEVVGMVKVLKRNAEETQ